MHSLIITPTSTLEPTSIQTSDLETDIHTFLTEKFGAEQRGRGTAYDAYKMYVTYLQKWWSLHGSERAYQVDETTFSDYYHWLVNTYRKDNGDPLASSTVSKAIRALHDIWGNSTYADWLPDVPGAIVPLQHFPDLAELRKLLYAPLQREQNGGRLDLRKLRDVAMLAWIMSTGTRRFETAEVKISNITFNTRLTNLKLGDDHGGYAYLKNVKGDRHGKKGRGRYVIFCSTAGLLAKCVIRFGYTVAEIGKEDRLFGLAESSIGRYISDYGEENEIAARAHGLRRAFSNEQYRQNGLGGLPALKAQMGHSENRGVTLSRYVHPDTIKLEMMEQSKEHYVSVLDHLDLGLDFWESIPCHIPKKELKRLSKIPKTIQ